MTRIALIGAGGRMGTEIARILLSHPDMTLAAAVERGGHPALGRDVGTAVTGAPAGVAYTTDVAAAVAASDVVLDVSLADATEGVVAACIKAGKPWVGGATGLDARALARIEEASATVPVLHAKNFSVGVTVAAELTRLAAELLGDGWDIEVVEAHHRHKVDAPSGTAELLADAATEGRGTALRRVFGRSGHTGARADDEIGIHAVRAGGIVGAHTVLFASEFEAITIAHQAQSRALFARGAVRAARFLATCPPGRYDMRDVLGLRRRA